MKKAAVLLAITLAIFSISLTRCNSKKKTGGSEALVVNEKMLLKAEVQTDEFTYVPIDTNLFEAPNVIQGWADSFNDAAIEEHAWKLWGGLTALTNQQYPVTDTAKKYNLPQVNLPVFSTWWDEYETFSPPATDLPRSMLRLHAPRQVSAASGDVSPTTHGGDVLSFNKYNQEYLDYIRRHEFYYLRAFTDLYKSKTTHIPRDFEPKKTMMLKPSFIIASSTEPVLVPYWKGPSMKIDGTTDHRHPISSTWLQWVLFNPTGQSIPAGKAFTTSYSNSDGNTVDTTLTSYEVVGLDYFYHLSLAPADVTYIKSGNIFTIGGLTPDSIKTGDLALLVACHVTSIEYFGNWTWQTFWWSPHPAKTPPASANVKGPFLHYDMMPAYYMTDKNGTPVISQNPYLEPGIIAPIIAYPWPPADRDFSKGVGARSNCMSCHHSAAFPSANLDPNPGHMLIASYIGAGNVTEQDPIFHLTSMNPRVNTNFLWTPILMKQATFAPDGRDSLHIYLSQK